MPHAAPARGPGRLPGSARAGDTGFWGNKRAYLVSLLKAWWGDAATEENDFCFDYLPRLTGDHGHYTTVMGQIDGTVKGYFVVGENPAVGSSGGRAQRLGLANLDWLVVRDLTLVETATFWKDGPELETGEMRTEDIGTEVFFLPAASHVEKEGTFTNTQRLLQWREKAVDPPGDCRSDLWFYYHLGKRIRQRLAGDEIDRPVRELTWDYPERGRAPGAVAPRPCCARSTASAPTGAPWRPTPSCRTTGPPRAAAGSTAGCTPDEVNQAARRKPGPGADLGRARVGLGVAGQPAHPLQPGLRRPRGPPVERAQGVRLVGRRTRRVDRPRRARLRDGQAARLPAARRAPAPRTRSPATDPFIMQADGKGWLYAPDRAGRRAAAHPLRAARVAGGQPAVRPAGQPGPASVYPRPDSPYNPPGVAAVPVRADHLPAHRAPHRGRR